jgi:hypothetical protein
MFLLVGENFMVTYAGVRAQGINVIVSECEGSDIERELL